MKNTIILILVSIVAICAGCSNKDAKAQAILVEAISYSDGHAPSEAAQEKALRLADSKGFKTGSSLTDQEIVMIAGKLLCDQIVTEYPQTPAALKAVEVRKEIDQRLRTIGNERIRSLFKD